MFEDERICVGTELKFLVEITADGFSMDEDDFEVEIIRGPNTLHFDKTELEVDKDGNYYVCFDTAPLGTGRVTAKVTAYVPDDDFEDGFRTEIERVDLIVLKA